MLDSSKLEITVNAVAVVVNLGVTKAEAIETTDNSDTLEFAVTQAFKSDKDTTVKVQLDKVGSAGITASDIASITYTDATGEVTLTDPSAIESFLTNGAAVVITAGSKEVPVVFEIADDSVYEGQETLTLNISDARNDNGASIGDNAQSGTINDEDGTDPLNPLDSVTVSIVDTIDTVNEGDTGSFLVELRDANGDLINAITDVTVEVTYSGVAANGDDFTGSATVTIPAGSSSFNLDLQTLADNLVEGDEIVNITISNPQGGGFEAIEVDANADTADMTIVDIDTAEITVGDAVAVEGGDLVHTITISTPSDKAETYVFSITEGTATEGADYTNAPVFSNPDIVYDQAAGTITVPAGVTEFTVSYPTIDDNIADDGETTTVTVDGKTGTGTINDEDGTDPMNPVEGVTVSIVDNVDTVNEGDTGSFLVELRDANGDVINAITDITVEVTYSGVAANGDDFTGSATVTIPAGSSSAPLDLVTIQDQLSEGDEIVNITISNPQGGGFEAIEVDANSDTADMTIIDGDKSVVDINATKETAIEGVDNTLIFTVSQQTKSDSDTTVLVKLNQTDSNIEPQDIYAISYTKADGTPVTLTDPVDIAYFLKNGDTVTIPAGQDKAPVITVIVADDAIYEKSEDMVLEISNPVSAGNGIVEIGQASDTGTIYDEDRDQQGDQLGDFNDGDETEVTDQGQPVDGNLLGNASETDADITLNVNNVQVDIDGDGTPDEITVGTPVDIVDADDNPVGSLTVSPDGSYTFTPDGDFTGDVPEISYDVVDGSGNVLDDSVLDLTVLPGPVTIEIDATKDRAIERPSNDDTLEFSISQNVASDQDTVVNVRLDAANSPDITAGDIARLQYTKADGSVVDTTDQGEISAFLATGDDVLIAAGSKESLITISVADDSVYEQTEDLGLIISNAVNPNGVTITTATDSGVIEDEAAQDGTPQEGDRPTVGITASKDTAIEGVDNTLEYTVAQDNLSNLATTVTVKVATGSSEVEAADIASIGYIDATGSPVTITDSAAIQALLNGTTTLQVKVPAGSTAAPKITVIVKDDDIYEDSEQLSFVIDSADNADIDSTVATGTIYDESDDPNDPGANTEGDKPTVTVGDATATEGDTLVHQVTVNGDTTQADVTYDFSLTDGSTDPATAGSDYTNAPVFSNGVINNGDGTITVPAGVTDFTVTYPTLTDNILENDETTTITIGNDSGTGTIIDNDTAPTLTVNDNSVTEATGNTVSNSFDITDPQSVTALTVNGQDVTLATSGNPITISGNAGTLVITNYDSQTGTLIYEYTENGNAEDHSAGAVFDQFDVVLTNTIGDTINDTLDIEIIDTAPTANDDKNSVTENIDVDQASGKITATGNVMTGTAPDQADDLGADATTVTAVEFGSVSGSIGSSIQGNFGELTLEADGSYTYDVDNSAVEFLAVGETRDETFNYTITDADGSTDTAKLTITITGTNDQPTITADSNGNIANISFVEQTDDSVITQSGIIAFSDIDVSDTLTLGYIKGENQYTFGQGNTALTDLTVPQKTALESMFSITQATNNNGVWEIEAKDTDIDFLPEGETITIRYAVQVNDNKGVDTAANGNEISSSEIRYVEVTITGTNDEDIALADNSITIDENGTTTSGSVLATIFDEFDTDDPDVGEQLTVESFQIGTGSPITVDPDNSNNLANDVIIDGNKVGEITFNSDGTYEYVATSDYSGTLPVITANVSNGVTGATREETSQELTITVNPVSDAPILAANKTVITQEDTTVALGLVSPIVRDRTDLDALSTSNDTPERIGLVNLSGFRAGTVLDYDGGTINITTNSQTVRIRLSDVDTVNNPPNFNASTTITMTKAQFESMTLTPPRDDATNMNVRMSVTEYEVNNAGDRISVDSTGAVVTTGGTPIAGATSNTTITVNVQAVTDTSDNNQSGDDASQFGYVGSTGVNGNTYTVSANEGDYITLPIATTFGDLVGSAANGSRETYGFVINNLLPGSTVEFTPAGSTTATEYLVGPSGTVLIGVPALANDGSPTKTTIAVNSSSQPQIKIKSSEYNSLDMDDIEVSLYTQDHDADSTPKDKSVELINTVKVDLTVTPVAGQVAITSSAISTPEDTAVKLSEFGFKVLDNKSGVNDANPETITKIEFSLPEGWTYTDANSTTTGAVGGTTISIDTSSATNLNTFLDTLTVKPPAHSSKDTSLIFKVTSTDIDDDGGNSVTKTTTLPAKKVTVTPVAEKVGEDTDGDGTPDLTINDSHKYSASAKEDEAFNLFADPDGSFNLIDDWSNQDTSEDTFAHMTFGNKNGSDFTSVEGAVFTYNDGNGLVSLTDNGNGVDIPMEYLDTVTVTPPQDYSGFNLASGAETAVKVEAKTVDVDEDGGAADTATSGESYLTFEFDVKGVADPTTLAVDPAEGFEDQAIIGGNNRDGSIPATIDPALGIPLDIRPSSRDNDGSETYDVTISDIPAGVQLYQDNNSTVTLLDTSSGSVTIADYTKIVDNLYFVPAENFSGTVNLKVQAVSKEDGTTGTPSPMLNLPVKVIGKADLIANDDLATDTVTIDSVDYTHNYITDEATLDSTGNHQIALSSVFASVADIEAYDGDSPAAEQVIYRVEDLPAGFNLIGAEVTFLGGGGTDRVWSVTLEALQNGTAQLQTPDNFAGEINFNITGTTTEKVSGDSVTHNQQNVSILVTPDAADSTISNPQVVATEDLWATIDFESAFTTTDQGGLTEGQEVLESITLSATDLMAKDVILRVDGTEVDLTTNPPPTLTFTPDQTIEIMYDDDKRHSDDDVSIDFDYTYTDTAKLIDNSEIKESTSGSATVNVTFQAVTDQPSMILNVNDGTIDNSGNDNTASVTVSISSADQDGSESFTRLEVTDVPDGLNVQGGILSNGVWYVDVPNDPAITDTAATYELVLERNDSTVNIPEGSFNITVTGVTQDINGQGTDGSERKVAETFDITSNRSSGGEDPTQPNLIDSFTSKAVIPSQVEDISFTLGDILDATLNPATANTVSAYTFSLTDLPVGTEVSTDNPAISVQQIGGKWIISVDDASSLSPEDALDAVTVTPPKDFSTNVTGGSQDLTFNTNFTALDKDGGEERVQVDDVKVEIKPVTDPIDNDGKTTIVDTDEDTKVEIEIDLTNTADGNNVEIINDKLYLQLDESGLTTDNGTSGKLTDDNGNDLTLVTLADGDVADIPAGDYYIVDVGTPIFYEPAENEDGTATVDVYAAHKESHNISGHDSGTKTYKHSYDVTVESQPDNLSITDKSDQSTTTASGNEDTMIAIDYKIATIDKDNTDAATAITLDNIPNGYLVYYTDANGNPVLASNNGNSGGNNSWSIDVSKLGDTNTGETSNIFIMPPENVSGIVSGIEMKVVNDSGMISDPLEIDLEVKPVADGVAANPSTILGSQGKWTTLNLNATMQDTDGSETVNIVVTDDGTSLTDDVLRFRVKSTGEMLTAVWDDVANSYTITGITPEQINDLQIQSSIPLKGDLDFALSTTDKATGMADSVSTEVTEKVSVDIVFTKTFVGTAENDILDASGQPVAVNYTGGAGNDILTAGSGNDFLDGGTGANTLIGGAGNDKIVFSANNLLMDGGDGIDTLLVDTSIDFSGFDSSVIDNMEVIDMTGNGSQSLTNLTTSDVIEMTDSNNELFINGDNADSVSLTADFEKQQTSDETGYAQYQSTIDPSVTLYVDTDITVI
ncbi:MULTISPECIES: VCBS domain-containing protein [unclassified Psychrobacter]|uniref:VCBS domain-containing protein n=1 Tax=unclassified Psychrobacter TaxID=196806 RepID=UPI00042A6AE8|nr:MULTISPECIES: VCBS domain-containing protein [unclassified Psychrobacter]